MEPLKLSQAIEENTLELFAWLYLFPITLIDLLIRPTAFLEAMTIERSKTDSSRFDTRMPSVLFFLLGTVPLSIAVIKTGEDAETMPPVTDAVMIIALVLAIFPFVWSLSALAISGRGFGRTAFREAFSTQCYLFLSAMACPIDCDACLFKRNGAVADSKHATVARSYRVVANCRVALVGQNCILGQENPLFYCRLGPIRWRTPNGNRDSSCYRPKVDHVMNSLRLISLQGTLRLSAARP